MKALVIEDSTLYQMIMVKVLGTFKMIRKVDTAGTGEEGLAKIRRQDYDVLFLDLHLPDMNGLQILEAAKVVAPSMPVIIVSASGGRGTDLTVHCLQKGALEFIVKPSEGTLRKSATALQRMIAQVLKTLYYKRMQNRFLPDRPMASRPPAPGSRRDFAPDPGLDFWLTTIAVSTGGPQSLARVVPSFSADYPNPILIVQHMPAGFTDSLARSLDQRSPLKVVEATDGMEVRKGCVHIAPGGSHMVAKRAGGMTRLFLARDVPGYSVRPSANVLFKSLAGIQEKRSILSLVMTGMGEDGKEGVRIMKTRSCYCLSQSKETCVVYGMPRAVEVDGLSDEVVDLDDLAYRAESLASKVPAGAR